MVDLVTIPSALQFVFSVVTAVSNIFSIHELDNFFIL